MVAISTRTVDHVLVWIYLPLRRTHRGRPRSVAIRIASNIHTRCICDAKRRKKDQFRVGKYCSTVAVAQLWSQTDLPRLSSVYVRVCDLKNNENKNMWEKFARAFMQLTLRETTI